MMLVMLLVWQCWGGGVAGAFFKNQTPGVLVLENRQRSLLSLPGDAGDDAGGDAGGVAGDARCIAGAGAVLQDKNSRSSCLEKRPPGIPSPTALPSEEAANQAGVLPHVVGWSAVLGNHHGRVKRESRARTVPR